MFVLGTAGHVDHGKSVLVHALTGIDPDRLREEKERGMTIDLGFAWLKLPSGQEIGIVDVPGHEHFIKNMLAGVGGIDLALLIVAADEGVMPQTREHLAILDLLRVQRGIVAITKKDLVDEERLSLVRMETEELIAPTTLSQAPVIAVSAVTGEGLSDLVLAIDKLLSSIKPRQDLGRPRLLIDRVFTIAGSGTVVTGTLLDGSLTVGQEVEIIPPHLTSRLRGLQSHKVRLNMATPGSRVAANLVGIATSQLQRGDVLTKPGWLTPTAMLSVQLHLLSYLHRPLRYNATVSFHTGATQAMAKVRMLEKDELQPGETTWAQLSLSKPIALVKGDHFIIRSSVETLGGGEVVESNARRHRRFCPAFIQSLRVKKEGTVEEIIMDLLETRQSLELPVLLAECNLSVSEVQSVIDSLVQQGKVVGIGQKEYRLLLPRLGWERLTEKAIAIARDHHRRGRDHRRPQARHARTGRLARQAIHPAEVHRRGRQASRGRLDGRTLRPRLPRMRRAHLEVRAAGPRGQGRPRTPRADPSATLRPGKLDRQARQIDVPVRQTHRQAILVRVDPRDCHSQRRHGRGGARFSQAPGQPGRGGRRCERRARTMSGRPSAPYR